MAKSEKKEGVTIDPVIRVATPKAEPTPGNAELILVSLNADGTEKVGTEFRITNRQFLKTYFKRTADGGAKNPSFLVKKN